MIGHCLGAAGAVGAVAAVMSVADGVIPPTAGWEVRDPQCDLDYVPGSARVTALDVALVNGFGFGGTNASLVVARCEGGE
jgi:3-oxoacyl-(acyl-carrier-protein) synthase